MDKFYQACYTRLGGADRNSGWQLTNTSTDIPAKVLSMFEQRQKGNEPVGRKTPQNVNGEHLCAMEIGCEADIVSLSRVQYGVPCYGREGFYSHGFLFPSAYELLKDPNRILALSRENFCFRGERPAPEEELELYQQRTSQIPEQLVYEEAWTVERAKARTGMNDRIYKEFLCCLYGNWARSARTAIYVKTDGTEEMAKAILYLAYAALPYSMRTKLTASTFVDAKNASLILTHEQPDGCRYFDPSNGMNDVLSPNQRKRWERMPFVSQFFENKEPWFDELEQVLAEEMDDRYSQDTTTLQTACQIGLFGEDADPVEQLYNFLDIPQEFTEKLERRVAKQLDKVSHIITVQGLGVSDDMESLLDQRLGNARTRELKNAGKAYKTARLSQMDVQQCCEYLRKNRAIFDELRGELQKTEKGRQILTAFYQEEVRITVEDAACTYEKLVDCARLFCDLFGMGDLWKAISDKAKNIASYQAEKALVTAWSGTGKTPLRVALDDYGRFANEIGKLPDLCQEDRQDLIESLKRDVAEVATRKIQAYDREFQISFCAEHMPEYEQFYTKDFVGRTTLAYSMNLLKMYQAAHEGELSLLEKFRKKDYIFDQLESSAPGIKSNNRLELQDKSRKESIEKSLYAYWTDSQYVRANKWMHGVSTEVDNNPSSQNKRQFVEKDTITYHFWCNAAALRGTDLISLAVEKGALIILSNYMLERSMKHNKQLWSDKWLAQMIDWCEKCGAEKAKEVQAILELKQWARSDLRNREEQDKKGSGKGQNAGSGKGRNTGSGKRDKQPGSPNKFTTNTPTGQSKGNEYVVWGRGTTKKFDEDPTDAMLDVLTEHSGQYPSTEQDPPEKKGGFWRGLFKKPES